MLLDFLLEHEKEILAITEKKTLVLAGSRPTSAQLKVGLPVFYKQLLITLRYEAASHQDRPVKDTMALKRAAASAHPEEATLASDAGVHGKELFRLGYNLSHVVHAYGSMCQAITELATQKKFMITAAEFHDLNRCLDVAIAGAVTEYQALRNQHVNRQEVEHLGFLAHELRNSLATVIMSVDLIKNGNVGFKGNVGYVLDQGLKRIQELIDRSLTEVRLRVDPKVKFESVNLLLLLDQIIITAEIEARSRRQVLELQVHPELSMEVDRQLIYSAIYNLLQNALKYTCVGGTIKIRGEAVGKNTVIEIEDECGGLSNPAVNLFKSFEQQNENRQGLGLGLTIAQQAVLLNHGTINVRNLPGKGCIFRISVPSLQEERR
jgi:signal transduction histidine kinase